MDGDNGYSLYDPFAPGCDPFNEYCNDVGGDVIVVVAPPPVIIINGADAATVHSVQNAVNQLFGIDRGQMGLLGMLLLGITNLLKLIKDIWTDHIKTLPKTIKDGLAKLQRIIDKILKPIRDALKAQRDAILDIYKRFIRPLIVFLESIRRFIKILQLFHIHLLDGLDAQLAKLERKIMGPFLAALGRINTLGNWISYILNSKLLIFRGLYLGTMKQNIGGSFSMLAGAPAFGMGMLPDGGEGTGKPPPPQQTWETANAAAVKVYDQLIARFSSSPTRDLVTCWKTPIENVDLQGATKEMLDCLFTF
jgi:hypothetical protein